ncbi:hypothetical protein R6Q59_036746 [Mikania micrantha]|uniref:KfrA N-terminal DNA-binding domain-containing protein n=1 Tax=Mikania micrantha TaxID=192012 RepID=A0A5N6NAL8_9ASTR|nr:hypothetical protein E3N88_21948 [Mikania micrantha]
MAGVAAARFQTVRTMVRTASAFRVFGCNPTLTQVRFLKTPSSPEAVKRDLDEVKKQAASKAEDVANQMKEAGGGFADKAKQSATEAWNATKNAAEKAQNKVTGKAEASAQAVKDNAEIAKKAMNTKK